MITIIVKKWGFFAKKALIRYFFIIVILIYFIVLGFFIRLTPVWMLYHFMRQNEWEKDENELTKQNKMLKSHYQKTI